MAGEIEEAGELKGRGATRTSRLMMRSVGTEKGHEKRMNPFTPSPGNVFSCVTRVVRGIFHPDQAGVITTAPGDGFWSKERILGITRVARTSAMRHLMGQKGVRKALGWHREVIRKASKETSTRLPPSYAVVFSRRASRVGDLPSEEKKIVYPTVVLRFFQQKSNLRLDTRHEKRGKGHMAN